MKDMHAVTYCRDGVTSYYSVLLHVVPTGLFHVSFPSICDISALGQAERNDLLGMMDLYHSARAELIHFQMKSSF